VKHLKNAWNAKIANAVQVV
jgi:hypothetical protein